MKKLKFLGMAAAAAGMVLLTSCLNGDNERSNTYYATVEFSSSTFRTLVYPLGDLPLYISEIANETLDPESVIFLQYTYNMDSEENANASANGFYVAKTGGYRVVKSGYLSYMSDADTSSVLPRELTFTEAGIINLLRTNNDSKRYKLIMGANHEKLQSKQENEYSLTWNRSKPAEEISGKRVYSLFLRASKLSDGEAPSGVGSEDRAFDITSLYNEVQSIEGDKGSEYIYVKIVYPKALSSDSLSIKQWASTEPLGLPIIKDKQ